jgi:glycosyltransferase involved in cell wall biosynthesis
MRAWSGETEADELADFDVGLMPLEDSPAARGKCGFKLIEYMAMGKPVIASAVGANRDIVGESRGGMLVDRVEDWPDAMSRLGNDAPARDEAGARGRTHVERNFSLDVALDRYDAIFRAVMGSAR